MRRNRNVSDRDEWLKNFIEQLDREAINKEDGDISDLREYNFKRYYGKYYGDERDGHSKFTTREVFEAVEWAMPSILEVFTANRRAVEFTAKNEADEDQAKQETDIINYRIKENNGFLLIHNFLKDILMYPNGYIKCHVEEKNVVTVEVITGLTVVTLSQLEADPRVEILEAEAYTQAVDEFGMQELYKIRVKFTKPERKIETKSVPPHSLRVHKDWTSVNIEDCPYICEEEKQTISDLVMRGFDFDELENVGEKETHIFSSEESAINFTQDEDPDYRSDLDGAHKVLTVREIILNVDYDDDGIAERRRVVMIGDELFENEVDNYNPYISCSAIINQHRHIGMSYVESVSDLQRQSTVITRQMLDGIYSHVHHRHFFNENSITDDNGTMDAYLDGESSAIIVRGNPAEAVMPEVNAPITQELLSVLDNIKNQTTLRTGVSPELSLDPNILKQSTEGAYSMALEKTNQRLAMLVRVVAELGIKPLMLKMQHCLRTHINEPDEVKIRGNWVQFDPSQWKERTKMDVHVGLGHNDKAQDVQLFTGLLDIQKEALSMKLTDETKIYKTLEKLVEAADIGTASGYFLDPSEPGWEPPQPQPDPQSEVYAAQAEALRQEQQRKMQEAQIEAQKAQQELTLKQSQYELDREKFELDKQKFEREYELNSNANVAQLRETNANVTLKEAQATLAYSNANQSEASAELAEANARKSKVESSQEYREAKDIIDRGIQGDQGAANGA